MAREASGVSQRATPVVIGKAIFVRAETDRVLEFFSSTAMKIVDVWLSTMSCTTITRPAFTTSAGCRISWAPRIGPVFAPLIWGEEGGWSTGARRWKP